MASYTSSCSRVNLAVARAIGFSLLAALATAGGVAHAVDAWDASTGVQLVLIAVGALFLGGLAAELVFLERLRSRWRASKPNNTGEQVVFAPPPGPRSEEDPQEFMDIPSRARWGE